MMATSQEEEAQMSEECLHEDEESLGPELYMCCRDNKVERAVQLLRMGVPWTYVSESPKWTCLHWAALQGMVEVVELLLEAKAQGPYLKKSKKRRSSTPLHWAALNGHVRVVWLLLEAGYLLEDVDEVGNTPLHLACSKAATTDPKKAASLLKALIGAAADPCLSRRANRYGNTPLSLLGVDDERKVSVDDETEPEDSSAERQKKVLRQVLVGNNDEDDDASGLPRGGEPAARLAHIQSYGLFQARLEDLLIFTTTDYDREENEEDHHEENEEALEEDKRSQKKKAVLTSYDCSLETLLERAAALSSALEEARFLDASGRLIEKAEAALVRVRRHVDVREQMAVVREAQPVITQAAVIEKVHKLSRLSREARILRDGAISAEAAYLLRKKKLTKDKSFEEDAVPWDDDRDLGAPLRLLEEAEALAFRSKSEYWVNAMLEPLEGLDCANVQAKRQMQKLEEALVTGDKRKAQDELMTRARAVLSRCASELDVAACVEALPLVTLDEVPPGHLEETPEYPNLPAGEDSYRWIPAPIFTSLRRTTDDLEKALAKSQNKKIHEPLLERANEVLAKAKEHLQLLQQKNDDSRQAAVAVAEKAAKRLKKKLAAQAKAEAQAAKLAAISSVVAPANPSPTPDNNQKKQAPTPGKTSSKKTATKKK